MSARAPAKPPRMSIGALSKHTGVNVETVRYYERIGLLPAPDRTEGGHRSYRKEHLTRLTFVRRGRDLGFSIEEIRGLLALADDERRTCEEVKAVTLDHLADVRSKIADLRRLARVLEDMADQCAGGAVPDCPIVEALERLDGEVPAEGMSAGGLADGR